MTPSRWLQPPLRILVVAALALAAATAPTAMAAEGVLAANSPPTVTAIANTSGTIVALQCTSGAWTEVPSGIQVAPSLSYSWRANGLLVGGANTNIYIIEASDAGKSLTCVVNALFVRGSAGTVTNYRGTAVSVPVSIGQPTTTTPTAPTTAPTAATVIRRVALAILVMPRAVTRTVGASGRLAVVSRVTCAGGCTVSVTAKIRIGRKNFRAELARTIATKGQALTLVLPRAARAALRRVKQGRANVLVTVRGKQGGLGTLTQVLKLRSA